MNTESDERGRAEQPLSRTAAIREKQQQEQAPKEEQRKAEAQQSSKQKRPIALTILLWMLRIAIVPLLLIAAIIGGLYVGYVILGKGPDGDVWDWETWSHLYKLIFSDS